MNKETIFYHLIHNHQEWERFGFNQIPTGDTLESTYDLLTLWLKFRLYTWKGINCLPFDDELECILIFLYEVYLNERYEDVDEDDEDTRWYYGEKKHLSDKIDLMGEFIYHNEKGLPPKRWMNGTIVDTIIYVCMDWMRFRLYSKETQHLEECFKMDSHFRDESKG